MSREASPSATFVDTLYPLVLYSIIPAWVLLVLAPRSKITFPVAKLTTMGLCGVYTTVFLYNIMAETSDAGKSDDLAIDILLLLSIS